MTAVIVQRRVRDRLLAVPATVPGVDALMQACSAASLRRQFFLPVELGPDEVSARYGRYLSAGPPGGVALVQPDNRAVRGLLATQRLGTTRLVDADPAQLDDDVVVQGSREARG